LEEAAEKTRPEPASLPPPSSGGLFSFYPWITHTADFHLLKFEETYPLRIAIESLSNPYQINPKW
jgi:hypothetical protein